jgi:hypothetical protein
MPTTFRHSVNTSIGTTGIDIIEIPEGVRATIIGCNLANVTEADTVNVDLYVIDESSTQAAYVKNLTIPPNTSVKVITQGEKLILPGSTKLRCIADIDSSIDSVVSYVEIS